MEPIKSQFEAYLNYRMPKAANIDVQSVSSLSGGASRDSYIIGVAWEEDGELQQQGMVLKREQESLVTGSNSVGEYLVNVAFFDAGLPVPEALFLEQDPKWLGNAFSVTAQVQDAVGVSPALAEPFGEHAAEIGRQFYTILGTISALDPALLGLLEAFDSVEPATAWQHELDYWASVVSDNSFEPEPIALAAIRWLGGNPPPPAQQIAVVHGDYRTATILVSSGELKAVLDFEMAHLGDPLEDLAWAFDSLWAPALPGRPGAMIDRASAIDFWEDASGLTVDPAALAWWELLCHVKGMGLWLAARKAYFGGANTDPLLSITAWTPGNHHSRIIADKLLVLWQERA